MSRHFAQFQLEEWLLAALEKMRITSPTPVQLQAIPLIQAGKDMVVQSGTGTGKTISYLLPILQGITQNKKEVQTIILTPTRELAGQVAKTVEQLTQGTQVDMVLAQGGTDINRQIQRLKRNPHVVIGTPGRILELMNQNKLAYYTVRQLVIDEADTILEMGFAHDLEGIIQKVKRSTQVMLFSATLPPRVYDLIKAVLKNPVRLTLNPDQPVIPEIEHTYIRLRNEPREELLVRLIGVLNPYLGIVFCNKKEQVDDLVLRLGRAGIPTGPLHGDLSQSQRKQILRRFREAELQILVATDIAARGLDVEGITHIINYNVPKSADWYIHRTGRTARAGEHGMAINLVDLDEEAALQAIGAKLNLKPQEKVIIDGMLKDKVRAVRPDNVGKMRAGQKTPGAKRGATTGTERPGKKYGTKPGAKPGSKSGTKQGAKAGTKPGTQLGSKPGVESGKKSATKPGNKSGTKPASKFGTKLGTKPSTKPSTKPGTKPGIKTGTKPGARSGAKPGSKPGARPGKKRG